MAGRGYFFLSIFHEFTAFHMVSQSHMDARSFMSSSSFICRARSRENSRIERKLTEASWHPGSRPCWSIWHASHFHLPCQRVRRRVRAVCAALTTFPICATSKRLNRTRVLSRRWPRQPLGISTAAASSSLVENRCHAQNLSLSW
jgi:hypothetical protein